MLVTGRLWLAEATECEQTRAASAAAGDGSAQQGHLRYAAAGAMSACGRADSQRDGWRRSGWLSRERCRKHSGTGAPGLA